MPPPPPSPVEEVLLRLPPVLMDELVEEVLLRLPPDEPAWLVRSSAVCKPWRRILAAPRFRRRFREFHGTPPVLGFFDDNATFVPTPTLLPAQPDRPWALLNMQLDCRHGRALFAVKSEYPSTFYLAVLDPLTSYQCHVPFPVDGMFWVSGAVLCAAQGCDHHGCQKGHFRVAVVPTDSTQSLTSGWLYSSETRVWSQLTSVHHPNVKCASQFAEPSVLVGDALYFYADGIIECQLGTLRLSTFEEPIHGDGALMRAEDGGLGFAAVVDNTNLTMWSMETGSERAIGWSKIRVIDLKTLLPDGAFLNPTLEFGISRLPGAIVSGVAEGTKVIFLITIVGRYMVDLKSGRVRNISHRTIKFFPYTSFYIPAMEAGSTSQGQ